MNVDNQSVIHVPFELKLELVPMYSSKQSIFRQKSQAMDFTHEIKFWKSHQLFFHDYFSPDHNTKK